MANELADGIYITAMIDNGLVVTGSYRGPDPGGKTITIGSWVIGAANVIGYSTEDDALAAIVNFW